MKFQTHNTSSSINTNMTCLQGTIQATRAELTQVFGRPVEYTPGDKVTLTWEIQFADGTVATIYDWKRYEAGVPALDEVESWHIGGHVKNADWAVHDAFRDHFGLQATSKKVA